MPISLQNSKRYGVELDRISGRIARQLYQTAKIQITGFEKTAFQADFFDVVIGNVPFGDYKVHDPAYDKYHFRIHDYFIAKALDLVRPGGMVAVITTKGTMDKSNPTVRKYLAEASRVERSDSACQYSVQGAGRSRGDGRYPVFAETGAKNGGGTGLGTSGIYGGRHCGKFLFRRASGNDAGQDGV